MSDAAQVIAQIIRTVDGTHSMGAAELGEVIAARLSERHAVVELPEGNHWTQTGEREWSFAAQCSEGYLNSTATYGVAYGVTFSVARDTPKASEMGGYPTCAEGFVPNELIEQFAAALLAAARVAEGGDGRG